MRHRSPGKPKNRHRRPDEIRPSWNQQKRDPEIQSHQLFERSLCRRFIRLFATPERLAKSLRYRQVWRCGALVHYFVNVAVDLAHIDDADSGSCCEIAVVEHCCRRAIVVACAEQVGTTNTVDIPSPRGDLCVRRSRGGRRRRCRRRWNRCGWGSGLLRRSWCLCASRKPADQQNGHESFLHRRLPGRS